MALWRCLSSQSHDPVDRPVIIGMIAVFAGQHAAVRRDQEVGRQPESTAVRGQRWNRLLVTDDRDEAASDPSEDRRPGTRVREERSWRRLHAEFEVETLVRIGDDREGQIDRARGADRPR